jgi:hypothetical protein
VTVPAFRRRPEPDEVARVTTTAVELLEVVWGRASTAPTSASQLRVLNILERVVSAEDRREVRLHFNSRGRAFLADLRARRERELRKVLADMPAAKWIAPLEGLEAFCATAATQMHGDTSGSGSQTA